MGNRKTHKYVGLIKGAVRVVGSIGQVSEGLYGMYALYLRLFASCCWGSMLEIAYDDTIIELFMMSRVVVQVGVHMSRWEWM